MASYWFKIA